MKKLVTGLILGLVCWASAAASHAETKYAVCVGINEYSISAGELTGCVNDAAYFYTNLVERGGWLPANMTKLLDGAAKKNAIRKAISNYAAKAVSGDTFVYQHSSHGGQNSGRSVFLCANDGYYEDTEVAADLRSFAAGVKVVVVVDACHSGGLFMGDSGKARRAAAEFDLAGRVTELMEADRARRAARGEAVEKSLSAKEIGWVTAANYTESSLDGGFYESDEWLTNPTYGDDDYDDETGYPAKYKLGGVFLGAFTWSWWNATCDSNAAGDGDEYADAYECWKDASDFCTKIDKFWDVSGYSFTPQCTNITVLRSVELGWAGKEEPGGLRFARMDDLDATVGSPVSCTLVATNSDGTAASVSYEVASATAPASTYSLAGDVFTFTPAADGAFSFAFTATDANTGNTGKGSLNVAATLAAPSGLANSGIAADSFTANWDATPGATSYLLDVASSDFSAKAAAKDCDALLSEDFASFSGTAADRSDKLDDYLSGTGWSGSKVFENGGSAKLGSGSYNGWIATPGLDLSSGGTVSFLLEKYKNDANTVTVSILSGGEETPIGSVTPGAAATVEFAIPAASEATSVKIATSAKRAVIDDLVVSGGSSADVLSNQEVAGTSFTVEGLATDTYYWRVRAVGNAKGPFSETMDVTLQADPSAPPSIRAIADMEITVGETATATVKVTAPEEAPVTSLSITAGAAAATLADGVFTFAPAAPGTYDFTITAVNANGPATANFAVVATLADPATPEVPAEVASDSFTAVWEAVPGAGSYELVVIEGASGSGGGGGGGGGSGAVLTETFADATYSTAGSGYANQTIGGKLGTWTATQCRGDQGNPTVGGTGTLTSPEIAGGVSAVEFDYSWPFSETASCDIDLYVGGNKVASANVTGGSAGTATYSFDAVSGATGIEFANTHGTAKKMRIRFDEIRITTAAAKSIARAAGDVVFSNNVGNVTSFEVTGLLSSTEYTFAFRAVAENGETSEWSAPVTVTTTEGPSEPAWSAIPAQNTYLGATFQLDLSAYLSGSPTPVVTADVGTVTGLSYVYEPEATGPVTVTLTAVNDSGTATVTFTLAVAEPPVGGNHYAVVVGCNKYDTEYIPSDNFLNGCVPDATHVHELITTRGQWEAANVTKLTDSAAKHASVLNAIAAAAAQAVPGDTFLYFHSSHGGNYTYSFVTNTALYTDWPIMVYSVDPEGTDNCICTYDADFTAAELAAALADFDPAVNIVVMIDACHSAGMFVYDGTPVSQRAVRRNAAGKALRSADPSFFAEAVGAQLSAVRRARGIRAASNVAFVTAANFDEYSYDAQTGDGGEFTTAFIEGVTNGVCDGADYGDQDGWATFYEGWNYAKDIATGLSVGTEVDYDGHTVDANGYAIYDNTYYAQEYDEPAYYYDYYFTHAQIDNEALLRVVRVGYAGDPSLDAPVANAAADVTDSGFTASWSAVAAATGYRLQVATDSSFSTGSAADTLVAGDLAATGNNYADFSGVSKPSGAVYAGKTAKHSSGAIQLNAKTDTGAGIWTTASGGNATRVSVEWNSETSASKRSLVVYGSDTALGSYAAVKAATQLGTIAYGSDTALDIDAPCAYVGIIANGGAVYLDSVTVDWGVAGSESTVVFDQDVGNVTSHAVTGLEPETDYWYRVQALGAPVDSDFSNVIALTTEASAPYAPVWSEIPEQAGAVGVEFSLDLAPYVSGSPKPVLSASVGTIDGTVFSYTPAAAGSETVTLTAANDVDTATTSFVLVVADAPVTVPVLALSNPTDSTFDADWTACTGAGEYQFQVATDDQFTSGGGAAADVTETFANATFSTTSSSYTDQTVTGCDLGTWTATSCRGDSTSPIVRYAGTLTSPSLAGGVSAVEFDYEWPYKESGTCDIDLYVNGIKVGSATVTGGEAGTASYNGFTAVSGPATIEFLNTGTSNKRMQITQVRITSASRTAAKDGGSLLLDTTTNGISLTVTGLEPDTTYYARVRMAEGEWSAVESITTTGEGPAGPAKYAVCVGLSEYDMAAFAEMGLEVTPLKGCVNDATYLKKNLTERGGWVERNVSLLTNGSATKTAIRGAIAAAAANAKAGDTFVYEHSSHGLQGDEEDDYTVALATYDSLYEDAELAEDLASFADGVKVVVLVDACHSGGLFGGDPEAGTDGKARSAASFDIARRVSALIDANRAARKARGEDVSRTLTADQIGWVTAAAYEETSKDGGYYDTDKWMSDDEAEGEERGGAFLAALAWGWWSGKADVSGEGDGDGWFDAYEGWSFSTPVCAEFDQTPQFLNEDVLRAVELGWIGDAAPSDAILFDPVPGAEVAIGEEATLAVVAKNADGTTDGIALSIVATDPEDLEYTFVDGTLAFTPAEDGLFLFTVQAVNGAASATKILGVTAVLPAPVAQEATDIAEDGFTANWLGVDAARNYQLQVSTDPDFPMGEPEQLVEEGFDEVTDKASLPEGWEFTGTFGTYASGGEAEPSIKLSTDGAMLTTPSFELNGGENGLAFWTKGNPGSGNVLTSTLTVQQLVGDEWKELAAPFVPAKDGETKEIEGLDPDATRIRFVMAKTSGNIAIDDVIVAQAKGGPVVDDDEIPADATSYAVEGLEPGTTYYFRVRAIANTKSAWSDVIEVTTAGEKPIPVPNLTVMASETSPDTSLAAFWVCTGAEEFRLQVATDEAFATLVFDETMTEIAMTVTGLTPETTYYVRVSALDGERVGDWSNVESITTAASGGDVPVQADIEAVTIDGTARTMKFAVPADATVMTTTNLVTGPWVAYEGDVDGEGNVVIPLTGSAAFFRLGEPPAGD